MWDYLKWATATTIPYQIVHYHTLFCLFISFYFLIFSVLILNFLFAHSLPHCCCVCVYVCGIVYYKMKRVKFFFISLCIFFALFIFVNFSVKIYVLLRYILWIEYVWIGSVTVVSQPFEVWTCTRVVGDWQMFSNIAMCSSEQENKYITETNTEQRQVSELNIL